MQYIYQILIPNEKSYIGITANLKQRHSVGKNGPTFKSYAESNPIMYKDMLVYGLDNVVVNVLGTTETIEEAFTLEGYWINKLQTYDHNHGYNHVVSGINKSVVKDQYYFTDEYKQELQDALNLIETYSDIRVKYKREYHHSRNLRYNTDPEVVERRKAKRKLSQAQSVNKPGYDTSRIDVEKKKQRAIEARKHIDKETHRRFLAHIQST